MLDSPTGIISAITSFYASVQTFPFIVFSLTYLHRESEDEVLVVPEFKGLWETDQTSVRKLFVLVVSIT